MLTDQQLIAFLATARADAALVFYRDVLGLRFVADEYVALVFESSGVMLRIQKVEQHTPFPYTALGWKVMDITAKVSELTQRGVRFERFPGMAQDDAGIWASRSGARVAWFKDPDGNVLSLTEF